jgi:phospholipid/cholesterol/gamma-HCH transport system ATP-binding protein
MIEIKNIEKSFGESKILKGISTVFETGKTNNHWPKWVWKNSFIKSFVSIHRQKWEQLSLTDAYTVILMMKKKRTSYRNRYGISRQCIV